MLDEILKAANNYTEGLKEVEERRSNWLKKYVLLKNHLTEIATYLNANATYKQGFFVDVLHAFNEEINGTSANMPSVTFRSGQMPMLVTFHNSLGEKKSYMEQGFRISFNPTVTGQVVVLLSPHKSDLNTTPPQMETLAIIAEPGQLTNEITDQIIIRGLAEAFSSSFTGMSQNVEENEDMPAAPIAHNPIGFKLHETTEKIS